MTIGEDRVRIKFNPSNNELVAAIKQKTAELIDLCEQHKAAGGTEVVRHYALAQTSFEDGCSWAIKAATA